MRALATLCLAVVAASAAAESDAQLIDKKETFGAVMGPSTLPGGATSAYVFVGLPEIGAGFRQGLGFGEWEARARANFLTLGASFDLLGKVSLYKRGAFDLAPYFGGGFALSSGARYFDRESFSYAGARGILGIGMAFRAAETIQLVARAEAPVDFALGGGGGAKVRALGGVGAEIYLSNDVTGMVMGEAGLDWVKEPLGVATARIGYAVTVGFGYRVF